MNSLETCLIIFGCSFGAGLLGMALYRTLPDHHLDAGSKDVVKLVMSLIATMAALVLSLLIASARRSTVQRRRKHAICCGTAPQSCMIKSGRRTARGEPTLIRGEHWM
jgi:hypothetical protein